MKPKCQDCKHQELETEKREFLDGLKEMTLEQRIARIEDLLYDSFNGRGLATRRGLMDLIAKSK